VDYLKVGQAVTVKKGNPEHFTTLGSLSGKSVSVESGTTNPDFLAATSKKLVKQGKSAITIVTFPKDTDAFAALVAREGGRLLRGCTTRCVLRQAESGGRGLLPPDQPDPDWHRDPQERSAQGSGPKGGQHAVRERDDETDR
jgi:hypothetical protein